MSAYPEEVATSPIFLSSDHACASFCSEAVRVFTLWDIMRLLNSRGLMLFMGNLVERQHDFESMRADRPPMMSSPSEAQIEAFVHFLEENVKVCDSAGLTRTGEKIVLTLTHIKNGNPVDFSSLAADCRHIRDVLMGESWNRKFVQVPEKYGEYVEQEQLFGPTVHKAFPSARDDIKQAGNCLAVEDCTGCVFHLMRAVEWGVRAFCAHLGIKRIRKKKAGKPKYVPLAWTEWQDMLEEAQRRVDAKMLATKPGPRKQAAQEFYYPLLSDIRGFKDAFRNHVMHARRDYTPKEADALLDHVKRFIVLLSDRVCE